MRTRFASALLVLAMCLTAQATAQVVYVDCSAPGPEHDGTSWDTAFLTIQEGVDAATPGGEVWVADGTYVENVVMGEGVAIYGGFLGAEPGGYEESLDQRDFLSNVTTIDGGRSGACVAVTQGASIDGFVITNGSGRAEGDFTQGGAIFCKQPANFTICNNTIVDNSATWGGGLYIYGCNPRVENNVIVANTADLAGGGIYCTNASRPTVSSNVITENVALSGGGIYSRYSFPRIASNDITNNSAEYGGGIYSTESFPAIINNTISSNFGSGVYCSISSATITNNTIHGNAAYSGGGIHCYESSPAVVNNIVTSNSADYSGGGIYCFSSSPTLSHNDLWANDPEDYYGCSPGEGDISVDPMFADPDAADFHLQEGSPCIDAGNNDAPELPEYDFEGDARIINGTVDMGADEAIYPPAYPFLIDQNAPGPDHNGLTWTSAFLTIQDGVGDATPGRQVWVADGVYAENVVMSEGVAIYGGFLGAEPGGYEESLDQRDFVNNVTAIDGNQCGSCLVMVVDSRVDGFVITGGSGKSVEGERRGGGIYCVDIGDTGVIANNVITLNSACRGGGIYCAGSSSPTIDSNTIVDNTADFGGGIGCRDNSSPTVTNNTITDNSAGYTGGGIACYYSSPVVTGNTITGNWAKSGGGVYCGNSSPSVTGNMIAANWADYVGGGIYCGNSSPSVANNTITGNMAYYGGGGGIHCSNHSSPSVTNNTIMGNTAYHSEYSEYPGGGGVYCYYHSSPTVTGNMISGNSAREGGAILCQWNSSPTLTNNMITCNWAQYSGGAIYCDRECSPLITSCTISGDSATNGRALACDSYKQQYPSQVTIANCILWNGGDEVWNNDNSTITITYSDVQGGWPGEGNIDSNPMFVNLDTGDFHLLAGSPCIDAGTNDAPELPETDWDGEQRIVDGTVDMGADEFFTWTATAPDPQPECDGPLFGEPQAGFPGWVWFSIPMTPAYSATPNDVLGFQCNGRLFRYDKYIKAPIVYQPPFSEWDLAVGNSYILWLDSEETNPSYEGLSPFTPWEFEFKLGKQGWTWIGMPGMTELGAEDFMSSVKVKYPSDETGVDRTAQDDYDAIPDNWITWGWPYWNTWLQAPETFTPYAPFGHATCYPWVGYRVWVKVGTAMDEDDPDQVTLIWP